jgi:hypothetical protein
MNDYCIVDFCTKCPQLRHKGEHSFRAVRSLWSTQSPVPGIDNLLYTVSPDNWQTIDILDNKPIVVASFGLFCV